VSKKIRPLVIVGLALVLCSALVVLAMGLTAGSLTGAEQAQIQQSGTFPAWFWNDLAAVIVLFVAGGIIAGIAFVKSRQELARRGIESGLARRATMSLFPGYALSKFITGQWLLGRLDTTAPVAPHELGAETDAVTSNSYGGEGLFGRQQPSRFEPPGSHAARNVGIAVIVVILILFLLMVIPLPIPFSTTVETNALTIAHSEIGSSNCISISGSWSTADGGSVSFAIVSGSGTTVYSADASSGTFSFNATDPPYTVGAYSVLPETVEISGTSWSPLIPVGLP
jgi:hypothetical protein